MDAQHRAGFEREWDADLGKNWPLLIVALAVAWGAAGWLSPISDTDLPMHLRLGEWITASRHVPFVEPFAWTRAGEPFFAYSWLPEVVYFRLVASFGAAGLHALNAITAAAGFLVVVLLGRTARWNAWCSVLVAVLAAFMMQAAAPVRPQTFLSLTVPGAWIAAEMVARGRIRAGLLLALAMAAVSVNVHLFFIFTAMPVVRFLVDEEIVWSRLSAYLAVTLGGWALTPYIWVLPEILALNLSGNPMIGRFTSITELEPGFRAFLYDDAFSRSMVILLLGTPLLAGIRMTSERSRFWYGLLWTAGLFTFGTAVRGLVIWFWASLPLLGIALGRISTPTPGLVRQVNLGLLMLIPVLLSARIHVQRPGDSVSLARPLGIVTRQLPLTAAPSLEPIADWISCHVPATTTARVHTVFNFGSYLVWRAPSLSYGIDGRGIFPDSVALAATFQLPDVDRANTGAWRSAQLAVVPGHSLVATEIAADTGWVRLRQSIPRDSAFAPATLFGRRTWLDSAGLGPFVVDTVRFGRSIPPPAECPRPPSGRERVR